MDSQLWSWVGGASLVGLTWLMRTVYLRRQAGKPPLVDPENKMPALDIPRDVVYGLIEEWYTQNAKPHVDAIASDMEAHKLDKFDMQSAIEDHSDAILGLTAKINEPKKRR